MSFTRDPVPYVTTLRQFLQNVSPAAGNLRYGRALDSDIDQILVVREESFPGRTVGTGFPLVADGTSAGPLPFAGKNCDPGRWASRGRRQL